MPKKNYTQLSFVDIYLTEQMSRNKFFQVINEIIDWKEVSLILEKYYKKGESVTGRSAYPGLILFRMVLLQTWHSLSDAQVEAQVKDRLSFRHFCGLKLSDTVPDDTVICRFRKILAKNNGLLALLKCINEKIQRKHLHIQTGVTIDASITKSLYRPPRPSKKQQVSQALDINQAPQKTLKIQDKEAKSLIKGGKFYHGYKRHCVTDEHNTLVLGVITTPANVHDSQVLETVLQQVNPPPGTAVLADKAYAGDPCQMVLKQKQLKNRILDKAYRQTPLSFWQKKRNKGISRTRCRIERVFGSIKRWFKSGVCRYAGLAKTHYQHILESIAYNIKIAPGLLKSQVN